MLYWHFRNIQCLFLSLFKPRLTRPDEPFRRTFWANPFDSDWMRYMYAGRFLTYTDAARWELPVRLGFLRPALKHGWVIIMAGQKMVHRRPIRIFRKFEISIQLTGWDDKWFYVRHVFRQRGDTKGMVFSKIGIRNKKGLVAPGEIMETMGYDPGLPPPAWMLDLFSSDLTCMESASDFT